MGVAPNLDQGAGNGRDPLSVVRFGAFEVDVAAGELRKSGLKIKLQEQPFRVLALLLERFLISWDRIILSMVSPSTVTKALSRTFSSSLTFPGQ